MDNKIIRKVLFKGGFADETGRGTASGGLPTVINESLFEPLHDHAVKVGIWFSGGPFVVNDRNPGGDPRPIRLLLIGGSQPPKVVEEHRVVGHVVVQIFDDESEFALIAQSKSC